MTTKKTDAKEIPIHQWTNGGESVLLVKCLNRDGTSYGGFVWPKEGPVKPDTWSRKADCDSGGLFGWPWGIGVGDGRDPDACAEWLVFSAKPENIIAIDCKAKAVPGDNGDLPQVVYRGTQAGAMYFTLQGRIAWIQERSSGSSSATGVRGSSSATGSSGSSSATGYSGSSSATGVRGSSSATGYSGSSSATGYSGSSSATGDSGSSSATGDSGSSSATGDSGSSSATGVRGSSSATGYSGSSSATGYSGSSSATGYRGSSSATGVSGSSSATGVRGSSSATGSSGSSSATGYSGSSSATGVSGSSSATGVRSISAITGTGETTIEVGADGIAAARTERVTWKVIAGAILIMRWNDPKDDKKTGYKLFDSKKLKLKTGDQVKLQFGRIVKEFTY